MKNRIQKAKEKSVSTEYQAEDEVLQEDDVQQERQAEGQAKPFIGKKLKGMKWFGYSAIAVGIIAMLFTNSATVDTSESAKNALQNQVSTSVSAGVVLLQDDENIGAKDYTINHTSNADETKISIRDYAAEDGDYVQVLVDGTPISEPFMIQHKPKELMVPATGSVQIKGIRDGGGGITYAVRYDVNGTSYFNSAPEGEFNTYELVR